MQRWVPVVTETQDWLILFITLGESKTEASWVPKLIWWYALPAEGFEK
jgi:hypothetical protein